MLNNQRVCFIFFKHGFRLRRVFGTRMVAISPSTHAAPAIAGASVFLYIYRVDHPSRAMFDLPSTLVIPNRAWIGLPHGSEVSGSAWAEPKQDQKALRSCKITQVLRKSSPQSVAFFRSAGFGVSFQLSTNQTQWSKSSLESPMWYATVQFSSYKRLRRKTQCVHHVFLVPALHSRTKKAVPLGVLRLRSCQTLLAAPRTTTQIWWNLGVNTIKHWG